VDGLTLRFSFSVLIAQIMILAFDTGPTGMLFGS
jgi:hypothetical protein